MLIEKRYKIWKAAATTVDVRPSIEGVLVARPDELVGLLRDASEETEDRWQQIKKRHIRGGTDGLAIATDGWILSIVTCSLDEEDISGLYPTSLFKNVMGRAKVGIAHIDLRPNRITLRAGTEWESGYRVAGSFPNYVALEEGGDKFPNFIDTMAYPALTSPEGDSAVYDPALLNKAAMSIGAKAIEIFSTGPKEPSIIHDPTVSDTPPMSFVMPMHYKK